MFGTARIPTEQGCQICQEPNAKHIVVMCRGQFYWFDALDDNNDLIMTERDLSLNLQVIVDDAQETPIHEAAKGALGVLSTENRKIWSGLRDLLGRDEGSNNSDCLNHRRLRSIHRLPGLYRAKDRIRPLHEHALWYHLRSRRVYKLVHVRIVGTTSYRSLFARTAARESTSSTLVLMATPFYDLHRMFIPIPFYDSRELSTASHHRCGHQQRQTLPSVTQRASAT